MESIIIKMAELPNIPAIAFVILLIYAISKSSLFSIIKASNAERLFFSHEKKIIFKLYNVIIALIITLFFMSFLTFLLFEFHQNKFISENMYNIIDILIDVLFVLSIGITAFVGCRRKYKHVSIFNKRIVGNETLSDIIFYMNFIISVLTLSNWSASNAMKIKENQFEYLIMSIVVSSVIFVILLVIISKEYISNPKFYYLTSDSLKWYIIKPLDKDTYLLGNNQIEECCTKIKIISKEILLNKEINIDTVVLIDKSGSVNQVEQVLDNHLN